MQSQKICCSLSKRVEYDNIIDVRCIKKKWTHLTGHVNPLPSLPSENDYFFQKLLKYVAYIIGVGFPCRWDGDFQDDDTHNEPIENLRVEFFSTIDKYMELDIKLLKESMCMALKDLLSGNELREVVRVEKSNDKMFKKMVCWICLNDIFEDKNFDHPLKNLFCDDCIKCWANISGD